VLDIVNGQSEDWPDETKIGACGGEQRDDDMRHRFFEINNITGRHGYTIGSNHGSAPPQEVGNTPWEAFWCGGYKTDCTQDSQQCQCLDFDWDDFKNRTTSNDYCENFNQLGCSRDDDQNNIMQLRAVWDDTTGQLLRFEGAICDNSDGHGWVDVDAHVYFKEPMYFFDVDGNTYTDSELTTSVACTPDSCSDDTLYGFCNLETKQYCNNGTIENDCTKCGYKCSTGLYCNYSNGGCYTCNSDSHCNDGNCMTQDTCVSPGTASAHCQNTSLSDDGCLVEQECGISPQGCSCGSCPRGYHCAGNRECSPTTSCNPKTGEGCPIVDPDDAPIAD
ncbi:hypothetical protein ACFL0L_05390, partial [Patescibacteria group bacterium]